MHFDPTDWVFMGGDLLMGPISSRCHLIRLNDLNSSFLLHHNGENLNIHGPGSGEAPLTDLLTMAPILVSLPPGRGSIPLGTVVAASKFGPVDIWVAAGAAPMGKMSVILGHPADRWSTYKINGLDYELRSSEELLMVGREAELPQWRLSVLADGVEVDWKSSADWDVTGLVVDPSWMVNGEVRLQRTHAQGEVAGLDWA